MAEEDWEWKWVGEGKPDTRPSRGRRYYERLRGYHAGDDVDRVYKIGDVVVMNGEQNERWFAQIVDFFQVRDNDTELREILHQDQRRNAGTEHYELMRCTLRWFYNLGDVSKTALRSSRVPKPIEDEIYFSDHVERDGYNDITVIEGLAFLVGSTSQKEQFLREPPPRYVEAFDHICVVRCFINSSVNEHQLRSLDKGELSYLLQNPTSDKDLYDKARKRMLGKGRSKDPVMKSLGKKRKRSTISSRQPVVFKDNEEDFDDEVKPIRRSKREVKVEESSSEDDWEPLSQKQRRLKRVVTDEEDEPEHPYQRNDDEPPAPQMDLSDQQARNLNDANDEVLDLVNELNASATMDGAAGKEQDYVKEEQATAIDVDQLDSRVEAPFSAKRKKVQSKRRTHVNRDAAAIVIDLESGDDRGRQAQGLSPEAWAKRKEKTNTRKTDRPRPAFMPTARKTARDSKQARSIPLGAGTSPFSKSVWRVASPAETQKREIVQSNGKAAMETHPPAAKGRVSAPPGSDDRKNQLKQRQQDVGEEVPLQQNAVTKDPARLAAVKDPSKRTVIQDPTNRAVSSDPSQRAIVTDAQGIAAGEAHLGRSGTGASMHVSAPATEVTGRKDQTQTATDTGDQEAANSDARSVGQPEAANEKSLGHPDFSADAVMFENDSDEDDGSDNEEGSEWWDDLNKVLEQLKKELGKIPADSQRLFTSHIEFVFDKAVEKVAERGFSTDMDMNDERVHSVIEELLQELKEKVLEEGSPDAPAGMNSVQREMADTQADPMQA